MLLTILPNDVEDDWPETGYGKFIRAVKCEGETYGVVFEKAFRVRCQAQKCGVPRGRILFHYYDRGTFEQVESREGPYRKSRGTRQEINRNGRSSIR